MTDKTQAFCNNEKHGNPCPLPCTPCRIECQQPLICPECGKTEVIEVAEAICVSTYFTWNKEKNKYIESGSDSDNFGDLYLQCAECRYRYSENELEKFYRTNPQNV